LVFIILLKFCYATYHVSACLECESEVTLFSKQAISYLSGHKKGIRIYAK
jgi:hypothetical protein